MIIRQTPADAENYILIDNSQITLGLQELNFFPRYIDQKGVYFAKSTELELALNKLKGGV